MDVNEALIGTPSLSFVAHPGDTPQFVPNAFTPDGSQPAESAVWLYNPLTMALSLQWVNPQHGA